MVSGHSIVFSCLTWLVFAALPCFSQYVPPPPPALGTVLPSSIQQVGCTLLYDPQAGPAADFRNFDVNMSSCFSATLSGCNNNGSGVQDMQFVYGIATPRTSPYKGTIVMLSGDGGEYAAYNPNFPAYVQKYLDNGYQVVEVAWGAFGTQGTAWELTDPGDSSSSPSILNAACRQASFLNWVRNGASPNVGKGIWYANGNGGGGMCAHGDSGGAGALGYVLAWYNAGAGGAPTWGSGYLDKVEMENGPVFSDINQGCEITCSNGSCSSAPMVNVCTNSNQIGCNWTTQYQMSYDVEFIAQDRGDVNTWTGSPQPMCANNVKTTTYNSSWQQMSVNIGPPGYAPVFGYPNTGMGAWLCETTEASMWNNATPEGGLFYANFTTSTTPNQMLSVNGVLNCKLSPEDIEDGQVSINNQGPFSGLTAIENDMLGVSPAIAAQSCANLGKARLSQ